MRPFRMFFGFAIGIILFLFVARILFFAFIIAAVMSIAYAVFRRIKDFITYDRFGEHYIPAYDNKPGRNINMNNEVEPLFHNDFPKRGNPIKKIQFVEAF